MYVIGSATSFSPITFTTSNSAPQLTITGLGLDLPSVRAVRFEPAPTCTPTSVNASVGTVNGIVIAAVNGSSQTMVTVTQSATIPAGSYSVCVDYVANPVSGLFSNVGSVQLLIGEFGDVLSVMIRRVECESELTTVCVCEQALCRRSRL